jgi:hypothetical protein
VNPKKVVSFIKTFKLKVFFNSLIGDVCRDFKSLPFDAELIKMFEHSDLELLRRDVVYFEFGNNFGFRFGSQ